MVGLENLSPAPGSGKEDTEQELGVSAGTKTTFLARSLQRMVLYTRKQNPGDFQQKHRREF